MDEESEIALDLFEVTDLSLEKTRRVAVARQLALLLPGVRELTTKMSEPEMRGLPPAVHFGVVGYEPEVTR